MLSGRAQRSTTVVWDLGNVLIPWDRTLGLAAATGDPAEARRLSATVFDMELNALVDAASDRPSLLDGILISGEVGITKPDPAIYRLCEQRFGLDPDHVVFIDDSPANVAGARTMGWDAVRYTGPAALRRQLVARALPVSPGEDDPPGH